MKRKIGPAGMAAVLVILLTGCFGATSTVLLRGDPPVNGMEAKVAYTIHSSTDGSSVTNQSVYQGINSVSPLPLLTTNFAEGASSRSETSQLTEANGTASNVLGMSNRTIKFGLTDFLTTQVVTYEFRDTNGSRTCAAKVRMTFQPTLAQRYLQEHLGQAWDALWYYSVPCAATPAAPLELDHAKLEALVLTEVLNIRLTGKPVIWNRGHSVTIVGPEPANLVGGWWQSNAKILNIAAKFISDMSSDLGKKDNGWLQFTPGGQFSKYGLVYSAGDADVYLSFSRVFLNRQVDYIVHFRGSPQEPWHTVVIHPIYNFEWNDLRQNWRALEHQAFPNVDSKIDQKTGLPKDAADATLKEIEKVGCQNCPNAALEQIQIRDGDTGDILYAMTVRGYVGSNSSLVMFGKVPQVSLDQALSMAEKTRVQKGYTQCPIQRDENGKPLDSSKQYSQKDCAMFLREGSLWDLLTQDPNKFGFDIVGQFQVRDNTVWTSRCSGSGENTYCSLVTDERKLDASYLFNRTDAQLQKAWTVMQLLGEVGVRTLGLSYIAGPGQGSGLLFGMEQPMMYRQYFSGLSNPEMVFAFDARALQLPQTLAAAESALYGS